MELRKAHSGYEQYVRECSPNLINEHHHFNIKESFTAYTQPLLINNTYGQQLIF